MSSGNADWWKQVPCHFTWGLEEVTSIDFKTIETNLKNKVEVWSEEHTSPPCHPLLFLGYLHVSKFKASPKQDPVKALRLFRDVEKEAEEIFEEEKKAFLIVSLANRLWTADILNRIQDEQTKEDIPPRSGKMQGKWDVERDGEMKQLKQLWDENDEKVKAYIEGIAVFAMSRLGPKKYREAERRCRQVLRVIPNNPDLYHNLGFLIGRQARCNLVSSREGYDNIAEEIRCYEKALELNPMYDLARCDLAQALVNVKGREQEAMDHIDQVQENSSSMIVKKGRFYRHREKYTRALDILKKGEQFDTPRGELFFQMSLIYSSQAYQAGSDRNYSKKNRLLETQLGYLDKCIKVEPLHHAAKIRRAKALGFMHRNDEAECAFRDTLEDFKEDGVNFVEVQFSFAEYLTGRNRKRVTPDAAKLYEGVVRSAARILKNSHEDEKDDALTGMKKFVTKAESKLKEFYQGNSEKMEDVGKLLADFHF